MKTRRTVLAALTAAAATLSTIGSGAVVAPTAAAAELDCRAAVIGITPANKLVTRTVQDNKVLQQKRTSSPLPYKVIQLGFLGGAPVEGGWKDTFAAIAKDGRPRALNITDREGSNALKHSSTRMLNQNFAPRLFTTSGGFHVFALDNQNRLQRLTTYRNDSGRLFFDNGRVALKRMGGLKTLSFYKRQKIDGVKTDILYATTKAGALKQIRVPVRRPGNARVLTVKRSGFAHYTGLSLGRCDSDFSKVLVIGISKPRNVARSYVLTRALRPRAANLTDLGRVDKRYDWKLHATL